MQTPVRTSRHRLACARRVSSPPSIPKSCFSIFPFKRVCACFSFPLFFNRSNPILSYFSFTSLFLNKSYYYIFFILFLLIEVLLLKKGIFESNRPKKGNRRQFLLPKLLFGDYSYKKTLCFLYNIYNYYRMLGKMENFTFYIDQMMFLRTKFTSFEKQNAVSLFPNIAPFGRSKGGWGDWAGKHEQVLFIYTCITII